MYQYPSNDVIKSITHDTNNLLDMPGPKAAYAWIRNLCYKKNPTMEDILKVVNDDGSFKNLQFCPLFDSTGTPYHKMHVDYGKCMTFGPMQALQNSEMCARHHVWQENASGKTAVITGMSSGTGFATAVEAAKHGMTVYGCARSRDVFDSNIDITRTLSLTEYLASTNTWPFHPLSHMRDGNMSYLDNIHFVECDTRVRKEINGKYGMDEFVAWVKGKTNAVNMLLLAAASGPGEKNLDKSFAQTPHLTVGESRDVAALCPDRYSYEMVTCHRSQFWEHETGVMYAIEAFTNEFGADLKHIVTIGSAHEGSKPGDLWGDSQWYGPNKHRVYSMAVGRRDDVLTTGRTLGNQGIVDPLQVRTQASDPAVYNGKPIPPISHIRNNYMLADFVMYIMSLYAKVDLSALPTTYLASIGQLPINFTSTFDNGFGGGLQLWLDTHGNTNYNLAEIARLAKPGPIGFLNIIHGFADRQSLTSTLTAAQFVLNKALVHPETVKMAFVPGQMCTKTYLDPYPNAAEEEWARLNTGVTRADLLENCWKLASDAMVANMNAWVLYEETELKHLYW
jgi:NAD(P)-dependent dehydrogenase (short-subunit alcohol dehydrogenase family)